MSTPATFADARLAKLDGFRVEIDAARERADVILDRPPLNVIEMPPARAASPRVRGARRG
jgi:2-oxoglutaroyl-CoA hydrolase